MRVRGKDKIEDPMSSQKMLVLPHAMFQIYGEVEEVDFLVQNVCKITYGDANATSEPLKP